MVRGLRWVRGILPDLIHLSDPTLRVVQRVPLVLQVLVDQRLPVHHLHQVGPVDHLVQCLQQVPGPLARQENPEDQLVQQHLLDLVGLYHLVVLAVQKNPVDHLDLVVPRTQVLPEFQDHL